MARINHYTASKKSTADDDFLSHINTLAHGRTLIINSTPWDLTYILYIRVYTVYADKSDILVKSFI